MLTEAWGRSWVDTGQVLIWMKPPFPHALARLPGKELQLPPREPQNVDSRANMPLQRDAQQTSV